MQCGRPLGQSTAMRAAPSATSLSLPIGEAMCVYASMPILPFLLLAVPVFIPQIHCQIATPWSGGVRIEIRLGLEETLQDQIRRWKCVRVAQGSKRHVFGAPCPN